MSNLTLTLDSPAATERLGFLLAAHLQAGDVVALQGALGAGKSVLARAIIRHFCPDEDDIPSPTFTLVQTYEPADGPPLMHFDLYRIETPEECLELGIEDAFLDAISVIEWPQRLAGYLPGKALFVTLTADEEVADQRLVVLEGGARWQTILADIATKPDMATKTAG